MAPEGYNDSVAFLEGYFQKKPDPLRPRPAAQSTNPSLLPVQEVQEQPPRPPVREEQLPPRQQPPHPPRRGPPPHLPLQEHVQHVPASNQSNTEGQFSTSPQQQQHGHHHHRPPPESTSMSRATDPAPEHQSLSPRRHHHVHTPSLSNIGCACWLYSVVTIIVALSAVFLACMVNGWLHGLTTALATTAVSGIAVFQTAWNSTLLLMSQRSRSRSSSSMRDTDTPVSVCAEYRYKPALQGLQDVLFRAAQDAHKLPTIDGVDIRCTSNPALASSSSSAAAGGCALAPSVISNMTDTITVFFDRLDRADRSLERFTASAEAYLQQLSQERESRVPCWLRAVLPGHSLCLADRIAEDAEALGTWMDEERSARQGLLDNKMLWDAAAMSITHAQSGICAQVDALTKYGKYVAEKNNGGVGGINDAHTATAMGNVAEGPRDVDGETAAAAFELAAAIEGAEDMARLGCLGAMTHTRCVSDLHQSLRGDGEKLVRLRDQVSEVKGCSSEQCLVALVSVAREYQNFIARTYRVDESRGYL